MTTVIGAYTSDGCVGRCEARCHNATSPDCDCLCDGRYHGLGAPAAARAHLDDLDRTGELHHASSHDPGEQELRLEFAQGALFA